MRQIFLSLIIVLFATHASAQLYNESNLKWRAASDELTRILYQIHAAIDDLSSEFPQLKDWKEATVSSKGIEYHYNHGKNDCFVSVQANREQVESELKLGLYLKFSAIGKDAEILKNRVYQVVENSFKQIKKWNVVEEGMKRKLKTKKKDASYTVATTESDLATPSAPSDKASVANPSKASPPDGSRYGWLR